MKRLLLVLRSPGKGGLILCLLACALFSKAQDSIFRKNNTVIVGRVTEVNATEIKYRRGENADAPIYTEKRSDITQIRYSNGIKDVFQVTPETAKAATVVTKDVKPRYVITLNDGTKLKGTLTKESPSEIILVDDNIGERTIKRVNVATMEREYGSENWMIHLKDGTIISGKVLSKTEEETIVQTQNLGVLKLDNAKVKDIVAVDGSISKEGKFWFRNPTQNLYFMAPTAIPLRKGEGYYHNYYGLGNEFNYGITDHVSMGAGLTGPFGVYITPRVCTQVNNYAAVSGGLFIGSSIFPIIYNSNLAVGLGFASFTVGNSDYNATASVAYGFKYSRGTSELLNQPLVQVSGMARVGKRFAFVTENWMVSVEGDPFNRGFLEEYHYEPFISYGCRILSKRGSFDIGFINTPGLWENDYLVGIPYVGFVIHTGKVSED